MLTGGSATAQLNTQQLLSIGRNALYFEDYVLSIQYFNQVIGAKPYLAEPYFLRALAKLNLEDVEGVVDDTSEAIKRNPYMTDAYELRGNAYQWMGNDSLALKDYERVLKSYPENRSVLLNRALALQEMKNNAGARNAFDDLISKHPNFEKAYVGRAKLSLEENDTASALKDVNRALEIDKYTINAYLIRTEIAANNEHNYQKALDDLNEAIKLNPHNAGFYINRAYLKYNMDDYYGAMSDYDYALQLDPYNYVGYYNRALLRAEVHDYNKAVADLTKVLELKGKDYRTLYNRATVLKEKGDYPEALADVEAVIEAYPSLAAGYFLRGDIKRHMGDRTAEEDFNRSIAMAKQTVKRKPTGNGQQADDASAGNQTGGNPEAEETNPFDDLLGDAEQESQEVVSARFSALLTIHDDTPTEQEYSNSNIRGKVQNRNTTVSMEPLFVATYYIATNELKESSEFMKEVDEINNTRALRFLLQVTAHEPTIEDEEEIDRHFQSIEYYNSYLSTHSARAIDYFGRGMDFMSVHNYGQAAEDFGVAIKLAPDFTLAYFMRSVAIYKSLTSTVGTGEADGKDNIASMLKKAKMQQMLDDIDMVIKLSPDMGIAYYNKGVMLAELKNDPSGAIAAFDKAISLERDLGEAYYNRGYVNFKVGNKQKGATDIRKAGELGVVAAYNLLKRMS